MSGATATAGDLLLERFDAAGAAYRTALVEAPAEALGQRRPGDDYTLGGLAHHVNAVLRHYLGTGESMAAWPVSTLVNNSKVDEPRCIEPMANLFFAGFGMRRSVRI